MENSKKRVGLIGAGLMGHPMGINWLKKGFKLTVLKSSNANSQSAERITDLQKNGAVIAHDLADLVLQSDIITLMLPTSQEVEAICLGEVRRTSSANLLDLVRPEQLVIDMTTSDPESTRKIFKMFEEKTLRFFDSPVTGGVMGAKAGTMTLFIGGPEKFYQEAEDVLSAVSKVRTHFGKIGQGHVAKIINNYVCVGNLAVFSEALVLGAKAGLKSGDIFSTLLSGTGFSRMLEAYGPQILDGDFAPRFKLAHAFKDILLAQNLNLALEGKSENLPVLQGMIKDFQKAADQNLGEENISALIKPLENEYNTQFRR